MEKHFINVIRASVRVSARFDRIKAGMNVARLNFSHGSHEEHKKRIDMIKAVRERLGMPIGILLDTKGPEYRIGTFKNGKEICNTWFAGFFPSDNPCYIVVVMNENGEGGNVDCAPVFKRIAEKITLLSR